MASDTFSLQPVNPFVNLAISSAGAPHFKKKSVKVGVLLQAIATGINHVIPPSSSPMTSP
jgi:hypothetical protein